MKRALALAFALGVPAFDAVMAETSIRPMPRPALATTQAPTTAGTPTTVVQDAVAELVQNASFAVPDSPARSIRPMPRPEIRQASAAAPQKKGVLGKLFGPKSKKDTAPQQSLTGSVCNSPGIRGTAIPTIRGAAKGCGVENPVRVTAVDGVKLSTPATLDCDTARALQEWVSEALQPSFGRAEVTGLRVAAHYACRTRNNRPGARISEHGRGKAIDIAGIQFADGSELTILEHYKGSKGKPIRAAHKRACGIFGTTLGPGSDGYHQDHLHLDTAQHRNGPYCK